MIQTTPSGSLHTGVGASEIAHHKMEHQKRSSTTKPRIDEALKPSGLINSTTTGGGIAHHGPGFGSTQVGFIRLSLALNQEQDDVSTIQDFRKEGGT